MGYRAPHLLFRRTAIVKYMASEVEWRADTLKIDLRPKPPKLNVCGAMNCFSARMGSGAQKND